MRSELVATHYTCNQRCGHCTARRGEDDRPWVQTRAVLGHWSIENDCNWVLDVAWATNAAEVITHQPLRTLSWLRMLAYNVLGWLLRVRLRSRPTWLELRDALRRVLCPVPNAFEMELRLLPLG